MMSSALAAISISCRVGVSSLVSNLWGPPWPTQVWQSILQHHCKDSQEHALQQKVGGSYATATHCYLPWRTKRLDSCRSHFEDTVGYCLTCRVLLNLVATEASLIKKWGNSLLNSRHVQLSFREWTLLISHEFETEGISNQIRGMSQSLSTNIG